MAIDILNGWNTFGATSLTQPAVSATTMRGRNRRSRTKIKVCESMEEVREMLKIDTSAAVTYGSFSADLKASYMRSLNMTSTSVVVVARVSNEETEEIDGSARDLKLTVPLETPEQRKEFFRKYGDSFISSVTRGFEVLISYVLHATSREEQIKVANSLSASGIAGGAEISGSFAMEMENFSKTSGLSWSLEVEALGIEGFSVDREEIEKAVQELQRRDPSESEHVVSFEATPYERLIDDSEESRQVSANLAALHGTSGRAGWAAKYEKLLEVQNSIKEVAKVYDVYGYAGDPDLGRRLSDVNDSLHRVERFLKEGVGARPWEKVDFPELDPGVLEVPSLVYDVQVSGVRFGGPQRDITYGMFGDVSQAASTHDFASVRQGERIKSIRAYTGKWMDGLEVTYTETLTGTGDREPVIHGKTSGDLALNLELGEGMAIQSIRGLGGDAVDALEFVVKTAIAGQTRKERAGDMNRQASRDETWTAGPGEFLLGFQGKAGNWLDTVSPIVVQFSPATWSNGK